MISVSLRASDHTGVAISNKFATFNIQHCTLGRGTFLSLNKKVPKEVSTGEALRANSIHQGMIATGNHLLFWFAARSTTSPVYPSRRTPELHREFKVLVLVLQTTIYRAVASRSLFCYTFPRKEVSICEVTAICIWFWTDMNGNLPLPVMQ